jgi:DNA-binding transcriptional MerR regulator
VAKRKIIQLSLFDAFASEETPVPDAQKKTSDTVEEVQQEAMAIASTNAVEQTAFKSTNVILPGNIANNIIDINTLKKQKVEDDVPEKKPTIPEAKLNIDNNKKLNIVLPEIVEDNNTELAKMQLFNEVTETKPTSIEIVSTYSFDEQPKQIHVAEPTAASVEKQIVVEETPKKEKQVLQKPTTIYKATNTKRRGRKSQVEMAQEAKWLNIPANDELYSKQYYTIGQVATMFNANVSKIRFWEEQLSSMLKVRKNRKGDRYFTPDNIRTLEQIYMLTSQKGLTMGGAAQLIENQKNGVHTQEMILANLDELKQFLLHLQASLSI